MSERVVARRGMALEDYLARAAERPFELIDGELCPMSPSVSRHGVLIRALFRALDGLTAQGDQWEALSEVTFVPPEQAVVN
ncbi:MAG: hypothetical protein ACK4P1_02980 [Aggregatilineales bacterium]